MLAVPLVALAFQLRSAYSWHWLIKHGPFVLVLLRYPYLPKNGAHLALADVNPAHVQFYRKNSTNLHLLLKLGILRADIEVPALLPYRRLGCYP